MTIKKFTAIIFFVFCIVSCAKKKKETSVTESVEISQPKLIKVWETDSLLTTCEAVLYDKDSQIIYVANVNNNPWGKDNNGFISTINSKGEILNLKWVEGLNGPKDMGLYNGKLYVNDIDDLVEMDVKTRSIVKRYHVEGAPQLNGITVSSNGVVYTSGSNSNIIYKLENEELKVVGKENLKRLNGLLGKTMLCII